MRPVEHSRSRSDTISHVRVGDKRLRLPSRTAFSLLLSLSISSLLFLVGKASCHIIRTLRQSREKSTWWRTKFCGQQTVRKNNNVPTTNVNELGSKCSLSQAFRWDCSPLSSLTIISWGTLSQNHSAKLYLDSWPRETEIIYGYYFKLLSLRVIFYTSYN